MTNTNEAQRRAMIARDARQSLAQTLQGRATRLQDCAREVAKLAAQVEATDENRAAVDLACIAINQIENMLRNLDLANVTRCVAEVMA